MIKVLYDELKMSAAEKAFKIARAVDRGVTHFIFPRLLWFTLFRLRLPIEFGNSKNQTQDIANSLP